MARTIGNPLSWTVDLLGGAGAHAEQVAGAIGGQRAGTPRIRAIGVEDIRAALRDGIADLAHFRSDVLMLCLVYPVAGLILAGLAMRADFVHLMFPVVSGFALVGPVAGVGLYELSRRREAGLPASWADVFKVVRAPSFGAIVVLAAFLAAVFVLWILSANLIYRVTMGPAPPASFAALLMDTLVTGPGWALAFLGTAVGFLFALLVLGVSLVSFPMLLDRPVGLPLAVVTSVRAARRNPGPVGLWGAVVAASLVVGAIPLLLGLVIVLPVLGHATWHLYRRLVAWE